MPELRQNLITRDWVIIATERARRPDQFVSEKKAVIPLNEYDPECPFCPGNEHLTTDEHFKLLNNDKWAVRVVPNKFPALNSKGSGKRSINGIYRSMDAFGIHDVVIEHPRHDLHFALYDTHSIENIMYAYKRRYQEIKSDKRVESIVIFRNHGKAAGTSLVHPHSQIVATPVVPFQVRSRLDTAIRYFDDNGECIFCRTLNEEISAKERIIFATELFTAFIPYAALSPFHIWIFPNRHFASFDEITDTETIALAETLHSVLKKLFVALNNPDFNFTIRSIPTHEKNSDYFHWYIAIVPRITIAAGFELGSGMYISTAIPEESAKFLRQF